MTVRVGVVGTGMMGRYFVETISESVSGAQIVGIAGRSAREGGPALTHASPSDLIRDKDVEAVIVATPDETHVELVLAALSLGKPVLCEKPLAPTASECLRVVQKEVEVGRRLVQVGYNRRFDPAYQALKAAIDRQSAGMPLLLRCAHRAPGPSRNRTTDLLLTNAAVHDIDAARWLLGEEILTATVYQPPAARLARNQFDPLLIILRTRSELLVDVEISVNIGYGCEIRAEVVCANGSVALRPPDLIRLSSSGTHASPVAQDTLMLFGHAYRAELQAWVESIEGGNAITPNAWDGYAATAVADACRESAVTGQPARVLLEERPRLYS